MTYQPVVPEAGQSPYPLQPPPRPHDASRVAETADEESDVVAEQAPKSDEAPSWRRPATLGAGAAIGIGSAALVAALLYTRRSAGSGQGDAAKSNSKKGRKKSKPRQAD